MGKFYQLLLITLLFTELSVPLHAQKKALVKADTAKAKEDKDDEGKDDKEEQGEVFVKIKPGSKDAVFKGGGDITYKLDVKSTYKSKQTGKLACIVTTDDGKPVSEELQDFKIGGNGSNSARFKIKAKEPGFYNVKFAFSLSLYDDTIKKVFGINPENIAVTPHKPVDFDKFWKGTLDTLAKIPPQYKITEDKVQSTSEIKVYLVEMRSWGNMPIKGWLTVPVKRPNNLPVRYRVPGYLVAMHPSLIEDDFAVFQINVRGNGNSKNSVNTNGQQYDLYNIQSKDKYIYRAVYMDCMRGLDFILANSRQFGLDTSRISLDGGSQGGALAIVVAALSKNIKAVTTEVPLYADFRDAARISRLSHPAARTPVNYINDYVKTHPSFSYEKLFKIWDYFDPLHFAPYVKCPVLMGIGLMDELCPPSCSFAMYNQLAANDKEHWVSPDKGHEVDAIYYRFQYIWLREHLLLP